MRFTKMHGCGNDYVYVDGFGQPAPADPAALAQRISDRHFGIGSDGLILILPSKMADARMRMWNADGSEGNMCGNGIRCVAKYLHDRGMVKRSAMTIETGRGVLSIEVVAQSGRESWVRVDMGEPILDAKSIPTTMAIDRVVEYPTDELENDCHHEFGAVHDLFKLRTQHIDPFLTCVSMGNPHAVFYCRSAAEVPLEIIGRFWEGHPIFPDRANVSVVSLRTRDEVDMRTWERGSGITLACGTGACAVCVAGVLTNRTERQILAHLPGGDLQLHWSETDNHVYMTGPAVEVFSGAWPDD
jgi:diaminopimelate epimerase